MIKLEDNRELDLDQAWKHEDSRKLRYQSDVLVKNTETISVEQVVLLQSQAQKN